MVRVGWLAAALGAGLLAVASGPASAEQQRTVPKSQAELKQSFAPIVKRAAPAVVNVYVRHRVQQRVSPLFDDPFFGRLFGDRFGIPRERIQNSLGSGVMVSPDGVVVTAHHVIQGGDQAEIKVALADGREFAAELVLKDAQTDLAVLRLDAKGVEFPYIGFADSDELEVGDLVLAIGDPFGVGQTVTSGIVSALARTKVNITDYQFFIQTDAAINPGNSGGALVDMDGLLVGINTAIFSKSGGSHGIGFAIPSNMVQLVVQAAQTGGKVQRPWFGAALQQVTPDLADTLGLATPKGALITNLHKQGPAAKAGLRAGDVVVDVDGRPVQDPQAFEYRFATKGVGGQAKLGILRKGEALTTTVTLLAPIEDPPRDARALTGRHPLSGAKVANLSPAVAQEFSIDDDSRSGVVVTEVENRSTAARLGLKRGDILVAINDEKIDSVAQLVVTLELASRGWKLAVERGGRVFNFAVQG